VPTSRYVRALITAALKTTEQGDQKKAEQDRTTTE